MRITCSGAQPSQKGTADHFTGSVRIDPLFQPSDPARTAGAYVTFEPCARSDWHTHPLGQTLIVTSGIGRVQQWGGPVEEIRAGDVVWTPPGVKHWHGASPTTAMTHIAIQEQLDAQALFFAHVRLFGGPAPVRRYLPELIDLVLKRKINPGKVFDLTFPLDQVAEGYRAMDERRAIKTLLRP
jgi:quercetin dioxygenase-like cupin family protein